MLPLTKKRESCEQETLAKHISNYRGSDTIEKQTE